MSTLIDGKALAASIREQIGKEAAALKTKTGVMPGLATVLVGDDPASAVYVRNKIKACQEAGIDSFDHHLPANTPQEKLLSLIADLAIDGRVHGILVQLPLPSQISTQAVLEAIPAAKDVDGFSVMNTGRFFQLKRYEDLSTVFVPATPWGVMKMLDSIGFKSAGKIACVLGRSNIVGKPVAQLLTLADATVTICHSKTPEIAEVVRRSDLVIAAIGKARFVKGDWVKSGAVVIDVGINRGSDGKLVGDCDFEGVAAKAGYITPVPGGVGPMTIAMLLSNTLAAFKRIRGIS